MNVKRLKEIIQNIPDETLVVMEGRWEEILGVTVGELDEVSSESRAYD